MKTELPNAVMQDTGMKFAGLNVFVLVPISSGIDPVGIAEEFKVQLNGLMAIATQPTLKDLAVMSAEAIPKLIKRALESEN